MPSRHSEEEGLTPLSQVLISQCLHQCLLQGGPQLTNGNCYAVSYVSSASQEDACSPILQWKPITNVEVYDLLLSACTTGNALSRGWEQVISLFTCTCVAIIVHC